MSTPPGRWCTVSEKNAKRLRRQGQPTPFDWPGIGADGHTVHLTDPEEDGCWFKGKEADRYEALKTHNPYAERDARFFTCHPEITWGLRRFYPGEPRPDDASCGYIHAVWVEREGDKLTEVIVHLAPMDAEGETA
jgi:hypothetical protein